MEDILKKLNDKFGKESPLTTCCGKVLKHLGTKIDYHQQGKINFVLYNYNNKLLEVLPTYMKGPATTHASCYLFNSDPGCKKLVMKEDNYSTIWQQNC